MDREPLTDTAGKPGWLTHNLKVLSGVSLLQDAASELLYPILPIFLTVVLGAPVAVVGAVEGLAEGAASLTKLASGFLGDRFQRRPLIGVGYGLAAVGKLVIALAVAWPLVLCGRVLDRLESYDGGRVVASTLLDADLEATGTTPPQSEGIIDLLAQADVAEVAILFKEAGDTTRISVRTKPGGVDATVLTGLFGGGGHARAAGATVSLPVDKARDAVLVEARKAAAAVTR